MEGTVSNSGCNARCLFDSGSSHFCMTHNWFSYPHGNRVVSSHPLGVSLDTDLIYKNYAIRVRDEELPTYLILLKMSDYFHKIVTFSPIDQPTFQLQGTNRLAGMQLISTLKARKLINKGCTGYLASLIDTSKMKPSLEDIPILHEYLDVFLDELPRQP